MANFIEDLIAGTPNEKTGENDGGLAGALDAITPDPGTPLANFRDTVMDNTPLRAVKEAGNLAIKTMDFWDQYVISRPFSTAAQAISPSGIGYNPLYRDGVQFDDFRKMWNASEYISPGRAGITNWGSDLASIGINGDWNKFAYQNGYDPYAMGKDATEEAWDSSPLGTIGSLSLDAMFQILVGGKGVNAAAKGAKRALGLSTDIANARDLSKVATTIDSHLDWVDSAGSTGSPSVWGQHIVDLANETEFSKVFSNPMINKYTKLGSAKQITVANLVTKASDPRMVRDIILADKGDPMAIGRLFQKAPDHVWSLSDMNGAMRAKFMEGGQWHPNADEVDIIKQTFDSALERDDFYRQVRDAFTGTSGTGEISSLTRNSTTVSMSGVAGKAERWLYNQIQGMNTGTDHMAFIPLGNSSVATAGSALLAWVGGRKPLNAVTISGTRPNEVIDEMMAYAQSSPVLRGNKTVTVLPMVRDEFGNLVESAPVRMSANAWRSDMMARIGAAMSSRTPEASVTGVVRDLEAEIISMHSFRYKIDPKTTRTIANGLQEARDTAIDSVAKDGFFIDDVHGRVFVDPVFRRQLANQVNLISLRDFDHSMKMQSSVVGGVSRFGERATYNMANVADTVLKYFRTMTLFKPGYVPKNSIVEPGISSLLAHGTILATDGPVNSTGRFLVNRSRMLRQMGYGTMDRVPFLNVGVRRSGAEIAELHSQRQMLLQLLDMDARDLDNFKAGVMSPSQQRMYEATAKNSYRELRDQLKVLETQLDESDPIWREVEEVPTYAQLSGRLDELDRIVNRGPEYIDGLKRSRDGIVARAESRTVSESESINNKIAQLQAQLDEVDAEWKRLHDSYPGGTETFSTTRGLASKEERLAAIESEIAAVRSERNTLRAAYESKLAELGPDHRDVLKAKGELSSAQRRIQILARRRAKAKKTDEFTNDVSIVGGPADVTPEKLTAKARDLGGSAMRRHRQSLLEQMDALLERRKTFDGAESERPVLFLGQEQAEIDRLDGLISIAERYNNGDLDLSAAVGSLRTKLDDIRSRTDALHEGVTAERQAWYDELMSLDARTAKLRKKNAGQLSRREKAAQRKLSGESYFRIGNDGEITIPRVFNEGEFGEAMRVESSSGLTTSLTLNPANYGTGAISRLIRSGGIDSIDPSDPLYFKEMAHIANRQVRGDKFATLILEGADNAAIRKWFKTPEGRRYMDQMGWKSSELDARVVGSKSARPLADTDKTAKHPGSRFVKRGTPKIEVFEDGIIDRNRQLLNAYFPSREVQQRLLAENDVTPGELEKMLAGNENLSPVHAGELVFDGNRWSKTGAYLNRAMEAVWRGLAANPESRFGRWPFLDRQFEMNMKADVAFMRSQGHELTDELVNNLRHGAAARALKEAENTFYNIRRYSNPAYALRFITGFPGAYFNSIYRYARLAYRNPGNALVVSNAWSDGLYKSFGIDENGDPTDDPTKVEAFAFTIPDPLADSVSLDKNIKMSTKGWEFALNPMTAMPFVVMPVDSVLMSVPTANQWLKDNIGDDLYSFLFPFGRPDTEPTFGVGPLNFDPWIPSYFVDAKKSIDEMEQDRIQSTNIIFQYRMWQYRNGMIKTAPTPISAARESEGFWRLRVATKFLTSGGFAMNPIGQNYVDAWNEVHAATGFDTKLAKQKFLEMYGAPAEVFTYSTSKNRAGMPYTVEAQRRLEQFPDLMNDLRELNPDDPRATVSLIFGDAQGEFDPVVYDSMARNSIPGETEPIRSKMDPYQLADKIATDSAWQLYNASRAKIDAMVMQYGYSSLEVKEAEWIKSQWKKWLTDFKADPDNAQWLAEYETRESGQPFRVINGMNKVLGDSKFTRVYGNSAAYKTMRDYLTERSEILAMYEAATTSDEKTRIAAGWDQYVRQWFMPMNSFFSDTYSRYLDGGRDLENKRVLDND